MRLILSTFAALFVLATVAASIPNANAMMRHHKMMHHHKMHH